MNKSSINRETFLDRLRGPLGRSRGQGLDAPPPIVDDSIARLASADDDLVSLFAREASATGMTVHRSHAATVASAMVELLKANGAKRIVLSIGDAAARDSLRKALAAAGIETFDGGVDGQFEVDAGITDVRAALAETGTLVCAADAAHSRGPSLIPPMHIALVKRSDIVPDMLDHFAALGDTTAAALPSSIAFITGPSKTADIEGILITGVHGPGQVHVLLVEDD